MKNYLKQSSAFLACCIAMLAITLLAGCKDHEEAMEYEDPPFDGKPNLVTDAKGKLYYSSSEGKWRIIFYDDNYVFNRRFGPEEGVHVYVTNLQPNQDIYSGRIMTTGYLTYKRKYWEGNEAGGHRYVFDYEILSLTSLDNDDLAKTRASEMDSLANCGTPTPEPPAWIFMKNSTTNPVLNEYNVNVFIHIVKSSKDKGLTDEISSEIIERLNNYYERAHISFTLNGTDYIYSDKYNDMTDSNADAAALFRNDSHADAIEIYVLNGDKLGSTVGRANGIPSTSFYVKKTYALGHTIAHEMGHCLGLYHTHHGTFHEDSEGIPELVNGSNSTYAGDFIQDTPADPKKWTLGIYSGGDLTDANGDKYNPDPRNIMSYSGNSNQNYFSPKQIQRIYDFIEETPALQKVCTITPISISGPKIFYNPTIYSIDVPDTYTVNWTIKCETFTSQTQSTVTTSTATGNSFTLSNKISDAISQRYTLTANIIDDNGLTFQCRKEVYRVIPNFTTGIFKWSSESAGGGFVGTLTTNSYTSNTVKVYQGGYLFFSYKDACGLESNQSSDFNFGLYGNYNFNKVTGSNNGYQHIGSSGGQATLSVTIGSQIKVIPLTISILKTKSYDLDEKQDSITDIVREDPLFYEVIHQ